MFYGYVVNLAVFAAVVGTLFLLTLIHFYTAFYVLNAPRTVRTLLLFILIGMTFMVVRALDPDGCFHVTDVSLRQWTSMLVTAAILGGASIWLWKLVFSVSQSANAEKSTPLKYAVWSVVIAEFATAIIACAVAHGLNVFWPTSIFLMTSAVLMVFLFVVLTYAAQRVRASISNSRSQNQDQHLKETFDTKLDEALLRLNIVHVAASILLSVSAALNLWVFVTRYNTTQTFYQALTCDPNNFVFDPYMWSQAIALILGLAYVWQPFPCACAKRSTT